MVYARQSVSVNCLTSLFRGLLALSHHLLLTSVKFPSSHSDGTSTEREPK